MNAKKKNQLRPSLEAVEGRCLTAANVLAGVQAAHAPAEVAANRPHDHGAHRHALARPDQVQAVAQKQAPGQAAQGQGTVRAASHYGVDTNYHGTRYQYDSYGNSYLYLKDHTHSNVHPYYGVHHNVYAVWNWRGSRVPDLHIQGT